MSGGPDGLWDIQPATPSFLIAIPVAVIVTLLTPKPPDEVVELYDRVNPPKTADASGVVPPDARAPDRAATNYAPGERAFTGGVVCTSRLTASPSRWGQDGRRVLIVGFVGDVAENVFQGLVQGWVQLHRLLKGGEGVVVPHLVDNLLGLGVG